MERNVQFKLKQTNIFFEVFTSIHFLKLLKANELQSIITTRFEFKRFIEEKLLLLSFQIIKIVINLIVILLYFQMFSRLFKIVIVSALCLFVITWTDMRSKSAPFSVTQLLVNVQSKLAVMKLMKWTLKCRSLHSWHDC